jgi:hypothetical protein
LSENDANDELAAAAAAAGDSVSCKIDIADEEYVDAGMLMLR